MNMKKVEESNGQPSPVKEEESEEEVVVVRDGYVMEKSARVIHINDMGNQRRYLVATTTTKKNKQQPEDNNNTEEKDQETSTYYQEEEEGGSGASATVTLSWYHSDKAFIRHDCPLSTITTTTTAQLHTLPHKPLEFTFTYCTHKVTTTTTTTTNNDGDDSGDNPRSVVRVECKSVADRDGWVKALMGAGVTCVNQHHDINNHHRHNQE